MAKVEYCALIDGEASRVWDVLKQFGQISKALSRMANLTDWLAVFAD
jgi:hypothetical protein